jgi:hypothetical protein
MTKPKEEPDEKKAKKKPSDPWLGKIILLIDVCVIALYVVTLIVPDEPAICRTVDPSLTIRVTTTTELPDQKAIRLGSIERIRSANIYLMITLGETAKIGSGTIIDADDLYYYAITNAHVLDGADVPESRRSIRTAEGILSGFEILVQDDARDLALIRFSKEGRAEILRFRSRIRSKSMIRSWRSEIPSEKSEPSRSDRSSDLERSIIWESSTRSSFIPRPSDPDHPEVR